MLNKTVDHFHKTVQTVLGKNANGRHTKYLLFFSLLLHIGLFLFKVERLNFIIIEVIFIQFKKKKKRFLGYFIMCNFN